MFISSHNIYLYAIKVFTNDKRMKNRILCRKKCGCVQSWWVRGIWGIKEHDQESLANGFGRFIKLELKSIKSPKKLSPRYPTLHPKHKTFFKINI